MKESRKDFISIHQSLTEEDKDIIEQELSKNKCLLSKEDWDGGQKTFSTGCIYKLMQDTVKKRS